MVKRKQNTPPCYQSIYNHLITKYALSPRKVTPVILHALFRLCLGRTQYANISVCLVSRLYIFNRNVPFCNKITTYFKYRNPKCHHFLALVSYTSAYFNISPLTKLGKQETGI